MCIVTGASGFLGQQLCAYFEENNIAFKACVRTASGKRDFECGDLNTFTKWSELFSGADSVIHLAGKAHDMTNPPEAEYVKNNTHLTIKVAAEAKKAGLKRFIFISTIKVNGEFSGDDTPFTADDTPNPRDPYARSKFEAEKSLLQLHESGVFEICIIRPVLIYGPNVKANFQSLVSLVKRQLPLPFGRVNNKRSLVSVYNLIDLIQTCMTHPNAAGQVFLAADREVLSLNQMIREIAEALKIRSFLIPVPFSFLKTLFELVGLKSYSQRLFANLHVSIEKNKNIIAWEPPYTFAESLRKMFDS